MQNLQNAKKTINTIVMVGLFITVMAFASKSQASTVQAGEGISHQHLRDCGNIGTPTDWQRTAQLNGYSDWQSFNNSLQPGQVVKVSCSNSTVIQTVRQSVPGNKYGEGWCTWYVKNRRPDIGNYWGNAHMWLRSAQNAGYATGTVPRVGAIAWNGITPSSPLGHVMYVESVNGDGTITVSEMAAPHKFVKSFRVVQINSVRFIY